MITAGDFRNGVTFEMDGQVMTVVSFQHVKPGKGAAFVRTKLKNVMTGAVIERSFNPTDKMPRAIVETKEMQYVYNDGGLYYFMDMDTYEQLPLNQDQVEEARAALYRQQAEQMARESKEQERQQEKEEAYADSDQGGPGPGENSPRGGGAGHREPEKRHQPDGGGGLSLYRAPVR